MREYKFRGMDNNKRWRYGFLVYSAFDTAFNIVEVGEIPPTYQDPCGDIHSESVNVIPDSIGQYTGIKSNGKELYEGDIIHRINRSSCCGKIKYEETQIIKWEGTGFYGFPVPDSPLGSCGFAAIDSEETSIIGNGYENPELLT